MPKKKSSVTLTVAQITKRAKPYAVQYAFKLGDPEAYNAARRAGILADVCKARRYRNWSTMTKRDFLAAAGKFSSRGELRKADSGLYQALRKADMWTAVCTKHGW